MLGALVPNVLRMANFGRSIVYRSLYGLSSQRTGPEVRGFLTALRAKALPAAEGISAEEVGDALQGMREQSLTAEVRHQMTALRRHCAAHATSLHFDGRSASRTLHGLRFHGSSNEVRDLIAVLWPALCRSTWQFTSLEMGQALLGFQTHTSTPEVLAAVNAVTDRMPLGVPLGDVDLSFSLFGVRCQNSVPEVRRLLLRLAPSLPLCDHLSPRGIALSLNGLRGQTSTPEVRRFFSALAPLVRRNAGQLTTLQRGLAVFGLQGLDDSAELRSMLTALMSGPADRTGQALVLRGLLALVQAGVPAGGYVAEVLRHVPREQVRRPLLQLLSICGVAAARSAESSGPPTSGTEESVRNVLLVSGVPGLRFNVEHSTGFEMDLLTADGVNVELDGVSQSYRTEGWRRMREMRSKVRCSADQLAAACAGAAWHSRPPRRRGRAQHARGHARHQSSNGCSEQRPCLGHSRGHRKGWVAAGRSQHRQAQAMGGSARP
eukprot:TRINITY_DN4049_c0_g1_i3.p1 TRINITY_DN4049_c0_g1~~TRINITY_DN4049_c0_g1_i3.p1  ORF type:complete len:491 (+),score=57.76 TRINITY_DN4049_c0_g1_i3:503-1975(+)